MSSVYTGKEPDIICPPWLTVNAAGELEPSKQELPTANMLYAGDPVLRQCIMPDPGGVRPRLAPAMRDITMVTDKETGRVTLNEGELVRNLLVTRSQLIDWMIDPKGRNLYYDCGYPLAISPQAYRDLYDREGHAARVNDVLPEECWAREPEIYDNEKEDVETPFEKAIKTLNKRRHLWSYLERIDKLSGIGAYGVLLLGIDDGKPLNEPVAGMDEETGEMSPAAEEHRLLYMRAFDESLIHIGQWDTDPTSPRYGQPNIYLIRFLDYTVVPIGQTVTDVITHMVHWTRVIHVADNRKGSEIFGVPRMQHPFNRLLDIRKIASSSGEMFFKGGFPGYSFEVLPELADAQIDPVSMRAEFERYSAGLQRYLALAGVSAKSLAPQVSDPTKHIDVQLQLVAMSIGIPLRILLGSEQAQLASGQDKKTWNARLGRRQERYMSPMLVRPVIDRLVAMRVLPPPEDDDYEVLWPDADTPTDSDIAAVGLQKTQALQYYVMGQCDAVVPPVEYLVNFLGFSLEKAKAMVQAGETYQDELQDKQDEQAAAAAALAPPQPPPGNAPPAQPGRPQTAAKPAGGPAVPAAPPAAKPAKPPAPKPATAKTAKATKVPK